MARQKRRSKIIGKAELRLEGIKSIDPAFEVSTNLTLVEYAALIASANAKESVLNIALGNVDTLSNEVDALVVSLRDYNTRFLGAVGSQYGKNSSEYEKAGGTRRVDFKRSINTTTTVVIETPEPPIDPVV